MLGGQGWKGLLAGAGGQPSTGCPLPFLLLSRLKGPWNKEQRQFQEQSAEEFSRSFPWSTSKEAAGTFSPAGWPGNDVPGQQGAFWEGSLESWRKNQPAQSAHHRNLHSFLHPLCTPTLPCAPGHSFNRGQPSFSHPGSLPGSGFHPSSPGSSAFPLGGLPCEGLAAGAPQLCSCGTVLPFRQGLSCDL